MAALQPPNQRVCREYILSLFWIYVMFPDDFIDKFIQPQALGNFQIELAPYRSFVTAWTTPSICSFVMAWPLGRYSPLR